MDEIFPKRKKKEFQRTSWQKNESERDRKEEFTDREQLLGQHKKINLKNLLTNFHNRNLLYDDHHLRRNNNVKGKQCGQVILLCMK